MFLRVGRRDVVLDEVALLPEVDSGVEGLDVRVRDLLVDGHQRLLDLTADLCAGYALIDIEIVDYRHDYRVVAILVRRLVGLVDTSGKFGPVVLLDRTVCLTNVHVI